MAAKKASQAIVWVILLLLIVGLAGFGATNFGSGQNAVASVGETEISVDEYARAMQNELRGFEQQTGQSLSMAQAQAFGLDQRVLGRLLGQAALKEAAREMGLSVGDEAVSEAIASNPAFQGLSGTFDRDTYRMALDRVGLEDREYEDLRRGEIATDLLTGAVAAGVVTPDPFVRTLFAYAREARDATWVRLTEADLTEPLSPADDAALQTYYDANQSEFMRPETRVITYVALTPAMLADSVEVAEDRVRETYEARADEYRQPERRLVERLVFRDEASADDAKARIDAGETSFDELVTERGLTLDDVDLGDVAADAPELGQAADAVFALEEPGVIGPVPSPLGPALFRVNAILSAREVPFEDVADELRGVLAEQAAEVVVRQQFEDFDDLLAGGATLEELAGETDMQLGSIDWHPALEAEGIVASAAFTDAARETQPGDFPELIEAEDGGVFALRVDEVLEPAVRPFDEVREDVAAAVRDQRLADALEARATALAEQIRAGADIDTLGLAVEQAVGLLRDDVSSDLTDRGVAELFEMAPDEIRVVRDGNEVTLLRLDSVTPADPETSEAEATMRSFGATTASGLANDLLAAFTEAMLRSGDLQIDSATISAINAQLQ